MKKVFLLLILMLIILTGFSTEVKTLVLQPGPLDGYDAYINTAFPNEPGWDKGLLVTAWTLGGFPFVGKSLLRFDLSELSALDSIIDARLNLYFDPEGSWPEHSGDNQAYIRRITTPWDHMTVTWNDQPAVTNESAVYLPPSVLPQQDYTDIDITDFVTLWSSNQDQNFGIMVSLVTQYPYSCLVFAPSERDIQSKRPKLVITYMTCSPPVAEFLYAIEEKTVVFEDKSSSATSWYWDFGDGYYASLQNPIHTYAEYGKYEVCLDIADSCGFASICDTVRVCVNPEPYFVYQTDNLSVSFTDSSLMPLTWWWDFGDGFFSNLQHPIHVFPGNGTYYVCETVTNECNTETYCDSVTVQSTWVDENRQSTWFTLYPNPAVDHIKISLNVTGTKEVSIKILNSYGLKKNEISLTAVSDKTMISIPLDGYEKGLYLICLQIDRITETRKFIVL